MQPPSPRAKLSNNMPRSINGEVPTGLKPWKPGQSGNPGGRPRGVPGLAATLKRLIAKKHPDQRRAWAEVLVRRVLKDAEDGDINAMNLVWKYAEGLPVAKLPEGATAGIAFVITAPPGVTEPDIVDVRPKVPELGLGDISPDSERPSEP